MVFVVDKVTLGLVSLEYFDIHLSVLFYECSISLHRVSEFLFNI